MINYHIINCKISICASFTTTKISRSLYRRLIQLNFILNTLTTKLRPELEYVHVHFSSLISEFYNVQRSQSIDYTTPELHSNPHM